MQFDVDDFVNHDLTVRGSFSYTAAAWTETVRLFNAGAIKTRPLVTHVFRLEDSEAALAALSRPGHSPRGKVLFDLRPEQHSR